MVARMKINAFDLFLKQKRFDLIFKYLYLKNKSKDIKTQTLLSLINAGTGNPVRETTFNVAFGGIAQ